MFLKTAAAIVLLLVPFGVAQAQLSESEQDAIAQVVWSVAEAVNEGDSDAIGRFLSPNADPALTSEIEQALFGADIAFKQNIVWIGEAEDGNVLVEGRFDVERQIGEQERTWYVTGLPNYFILEKVDGMWKILETDFHTMLSGGDALKAFSKQFAVVGIFILLTSLFWFWMLIDAIRSPIDNKIVWILVIFFLHVIGAVLYFFTERRNYRREEV